MIRGLNQFLESGDAVGGFRYFRRRSVDSHRFTADNILIQNFTQSGLQVEVTFAVIQLSSSSSSSKTVLSSKSLIKTLQWDEGRAALAGALGLSASKAIVTSPSRDREKKKSSTPAIVLTLLFAALLVCIAGYIYYRKK